MDIAGAPFFLLSLPLFFSIYLFIRSMNTQDTRNGRVWIKLIKSSAPPEKNRQREEDRCFRSDLITLPT